MDALEMLKTYIGDDISQRFHQKQEDPYLGRQKIFFLPGGALTKRLCLRC